MEIDATGAKSRPRFAWCVLPAVDAETPMQGQYIRNPPLTLRVAPLTYEA